MASERRVVIVGGGISGLVAALEVQRLTRAHGQSVRVDLFEAAERLGGKIFTERIGAFLVEGGPDTFLASKPAGMELCRELDLAEQLISTRPETRQSYLSHGGVLAPLPDGMSGLVPLGVRGLLGSPLLSRRARIRACLERFVRSKINGDDESVFNFAARRFGNEVAERIVEPLLSGIYAGDGRKLSAAAAIPQLYEMEKEFGSVSRGLRVRANAPRANRTTVPFVSLLEGMGSLIERLQNRLDDVHVHASTLVREVYNQGNQFRVDAGSDSIRADTVVLATPSYQSAEILRSWVPALSNELDAIRFVSTATVTMGFTPAPAGVPRHGYGYIVPRAEGRAVTACSWTTLKLPNRSSEGSFLLRIFVGRDGANAAATLPDDRLVTMARGEIKRTLGIREMPAMVRISRHDRAMPQYSLGHVDRLGRIDALLAAEPGLFVAGCSYRGVGVPDCIASGRRAGLDAFRSLGLDSTQ